MFFVGWNNPKKCVLLCLGLTLNYKQNRKNKFVVTKEVLKYTEPKRKN